MNEFPIWMPISPLSVCADDQFQITDTLYAGATISAISVKLFLGSTDVTAINMTTGAESFSGNVYTTKVIKSLKGRNTYVLACVVSIDSVVTTRKCIIKVKKVHEAL